MFEINGELWRVILVPPWDPSLRRSNGSYSIGSCCDDTKTIAIMKNLTPFMMTKVLCHEITHAAMFSYNIELTLEQEELFADLMATYGQEIISLTNKIRGA